MTNQRRKLSDIIAGGDSLIKLKAAWDRTDAAADRGPLPAGTYQARVLSGELFTARTGTAGYKITFQVCEGEYDGRRFWLDLWITDASMPKLKRDLPKLGITDLAMLDRPLPDGIIVRAKVVQHTSDKGAVYNDVKQFEVVAIERDPFAPKEDNDQAEGEPKGPSFLRSPGNGTVVAVDGPYRDRR